MATLVHDIALTASAAARVAAIAAKQGKPAILRLAVDGGGCSGFQYGMTLEEEGMEGDQNFEVNGVKVIIDPRSADYLEGANIDFVDNLMGGGFKIDNPNAKSSCGCGHSFTPKDGEEGDMEPAAAGSGCGSCSSGGGF